MEVNINEIAKPRMEAKTEIIADVLDEIDKFAKEFLCGGVLGKPQFDILKKRINNLLIEN